jgi:hypothetical protein
MSNGFEVGCCSPFSHCRPTHTFIYELEIACTSVWDVFSYLEALEFILAGSARSCYYSSNPGIRTIDDVVVDKVQRKKTSDTR